MQDKNVRDYKTNTMKKTAASEVKVVKGNSTLYKDKICS
jgi:hypothetical protein